MIWLIITIIVSAISALWFYFEVPVRKQKKFLESVPGPPILPIIGNLLDLRGHDYITFLETQQQKYGKLFKIQLAGQLRVVCSDLKDIEIILRSSSSLNKPQSTYLGPFLGNGLVLSSGAHWKEMRKIINPAFNINILEKFTVVFNEQADILTKVLREKPQNESIDIQPTLMFFALDILCETAMGIKINAQTEGEANNYVAAIERLARIMSRRFKNLILSAPWLFKLTSLGRKHDKYVKILKDIAFKIIEKRRNELLKNGNSKDEDHEDGTRKRLAFLDLLLQTYHSNGEPLTNEEITDEVNTFMVAGHVTTGFQMGYILYLLSQHPEAQDLIYKEQLQILGDIKQTPTFRQLQNMDYLERVIKESLRMHGGFPAFARAISEELTLSNGLTVPKNVVFTIFAGHIHKNPEIYPEPEKFIPDRFLPENVRKRGAYTFLSFSSGQRNCIGHKFAMLEIKICISTIVRNFKILPAYEPDGSLWKPKFMLKVLQSTGNGMHIQLAPR